MRKINASFFLIIFFFIFNLHSFAQRRSIDQWFVDVNIGPTVFIGDIRSADFFPSFHKPVEVGYALGGIFGKSMGEYVNVRSQFIYGQLNGVKPVSDFNFKTKFLSAGLGAEFNLNNLFSGSNRSNFIFYGTLGANYISWNADLFKTSTSAVLNNEKTAAFSIPIGLKIMYELSSNLFLSMEGALHIVTSDLVDAKPGGITHDDINYNNVGLTYKFDSFKKRRKVLYQPRIARTPQTRIAPPVIDTTLVLVEDTAMVKEEEYDAEQKIKQNLIRTETEKRMEEKYLSDLIEQERKNEVQGFIGDKPDYRVSILRTLSETDPVQLQKELKIPETIYEIQTPNGGFNYLVGSFDKSWKAKELRNKLISINHVGQPKVVLYKDGKTMLMQDAYKLAVAAQQKTGDTSILKNSIYESLKLEQNIPEKGLFFGVQILSVQKETYPLQLITDLYEIEGNIMIDQADGWSRLIVDGFKTLDEAEKATIELRKKGFTDAFVIAYYNGSRIPPSKIPEYLKAKE